MDYSYFFMSDSVLVYAISYIMTPFCILIPIFGLLGERNAVKPQRPKGLLRKIVPWLVLLWLLSDVAMLVWHCVEYTWFAQSQLPADVFDNPSQFSAMSTLWGLANTQQAQILTSLSACACSLCWTVYAFHFQPSPTPWWKKVLKIIAYVLLTFIMFGFYKDGLFGLLVCFVLLVVAVLLLWAAHVKPRQEPAKDAQADEKAAAEAQQATDENSEAEPEVTHCPHCGRPVKADSKFCEYCGQKI